MTDKWTGRIYRDNDPRYKGTVQKALEMKATVSVDADTKPRFTIEKCLAVRCRDCGVVDIGLYRDLLKVRITVLEKTHECKRKS